MPRYGESAQESVERTMRKRKHGTLRSGQSHKAEGDIEVNGFGEQVLGIWTQDLALYDTAASLVGSSGSARINK